MKHLINTYRQLLNLQNAIFLRIDHEDAMVAVVYKIIKSNGEQLILKICDRSNDYLREVRFLTYFAEILPVPKIIQIVEPFEGVHGAILMEYLPGTLLKTDDLTETLAFEIGRCLALIHLDRLSGYGDPVRCDLSPDPRGYLTLKFEEGLEECRHHLPIELIEQCQSYFEANIDLLMSVDGPCIVHRDFRPGNLIVHNGKLQGIIDWSGARASFAEEDFCSMEHGEWTQNPHIKKSLLTGYASIRPIPDYQALISFLRLNKAIATVGFTVKRGTWKNTNSRVYQYNRQFLETFLKHYGHINNETPVIDTTLARLLIDTQFPQWKDLSIRPVKSSGWDNRTFHLGEEMLVRMPSAAEYEAQVEKEHHWLPKLAPFLPLQIPVPVVMGQPTEDYPWKWSIYRWIEGESAASSHLIDFREFAIDLANFLLAFQNIDSAGGPLPGLHNFYRGGSLTIYDSEVKQALTVLSNRVDIKAATEIWETALKTAWLGRFVWVHGDISAGNLLIKNGHLSAVIDFGQLAIGDPSCDLVIAWTLFQGQSREIFRRTLNLDKDTWARGRAWTLWKALIIAANFTNPSNAESSQCWRIIDEVVEDHKLQKDQL